MKDLFCIFIITNLLLSCTGISQTGKTEPESQTKKPIITNSNNNKPVPGTEEAMASDKVTGTASRETTIENKIVIKAPERVSTSSGLTAGTADDNKQFNYFLSFLEKYKNNVEYIPIPIGERIILNIQDKNGKSLPNARIIIRLADTILCSGTSYNDGTFTFYPLLYTNTATGSQSQQTNYRADVTFNQQVKELTFSRTGTRTVKIILDHPRPEQTKIPLDMLFIMDTTGSMGEEIERLKATIEIININLISLASKPALRFGMVLYKDQLDEEYVTRVIPLTGDLNSFQKQLAGVTAEGGGDRPEDLQSALEAAIKNIDWNENGIRLGFIITDAPAHISTYNPAYTYKDASLAAKSKAIKFFSVGTGGLDLNGEYVLRQISQLTQAKYIFLTRGETGESEGGKEGSVSHHTGSNFQTDKLENIIIRQAKEELAWLMDKPFTNTGDDYFLAVKIPEETKQTTLKTLFDKILTQLVDFASYKLDPGTPTAIIPFAIPDTKTANPTLASTQQTDNNLQLNAEYFTEEIIQALVRNSSFKAIERKNMQLIFKELELQLSGLTDDNQATRIGQILGANLLITGMLYQKENDYELFLKLIKVETAEIIAVTKAHIDAQLGL